MDNFELIIFDFDGTLCDTHSAIKFCIAETFVRFGLAVPSEAAVSATLLTGMGLIETFESLRPVGFTDKPASEFVSTYRSIYNGGAGIEKSTLFDGAFQTLETLAGFGSPVVITSNKGERSIVDALNFHNVEQFVDLVVGDDGQTPMKPDPQSFVTRIHPHYSDTKCDRIVVVGDTIADIQYARNSGVFSCWVSCGYGDPSTCKAAQPDYVAERLIDVLDLKVPETSA